MVEKVVFGSELIKKQHYWPKGVMEEDMFQHMHRKEFDNVDELPNTNYGNSYHIISLKDTDFIMLMMTTYGTLDN